MSEIKQLNGVVKTYAWGSYSVLAGNRGAENSKQPEAELWFGDFPNGGLPVLAKILAVAQTLSLQVHPDKSQVSKTPELFSDANHKPEMLVALSDFYALVGIASESEIIEAVNSMGCVSISDFLIPKIENGDSISDLLKILLGAPDNLNLIPDLITNLQKVVNPSDRQSWSLEVANRYPDRLDVLATLLCNFVKLTPGQAIYLPPRTIHAYLNGTGVEVMAASDNVVRGGLTNKPINLNLFLEIADTSAKSLESYLIAPEELVNGKAWRAGDLKLLELPLTDNPKPHLAMAESIAFVWGGQAVVSKESGEISITIGGNLGAIIPAGQFEYAGTGSLWLASQG
jgi:mannose-6-phosphate isomerase